MRDALDHHRGGAKSAFSTRCELSDGAKRIFNPLVTNSMQDSDAEALARLSSHLGVEPALDELQGLEEALERQVTLARGYEARQLANAQRDLSFAEFDYQSLQETAAADAAVAAASVAASAQAAEEAGLRLAEADDRAERAAAQSAIDAQRAADAEASCREAVQRAARLNDELVAAATAATSAADRVEALTSTHAKACQELEAVRADARRLGEDRAGDAEAARVARQQFEHALLLIEQRAAAAEHATAATALDGAVLVAAAQAEARRQGELREAAAAALRGAVAREAAAAAARAVAAAAAAERIARAEHEAAAAGKRAAALEAERRQAEERVRPIRAEAAAAEEEAGAASAAPRRAPAQAFSALEDEIILDACGGDVPEAAVERGRLATLLCERLPGRQRSAVLSHLLVLYRKQMDGKHVQEQLEQVLNNINLPKEPLPRVETGAMLLPHSLVRHVYEFQPEATTFSLQGGRLSGSSSGRATMFDQQGLLLEQKLPSPARIPPR